MKLELTKDTSCILITPGDTGPTVKALFPKDLTDSHVAYAAALVQMLMKVLSDTDAAALVAKHMDILGATPPDALVDVDISKLPILKPTEIDCDYKCSACPRHKRPRPKKD